MPKPIAPNETHLYKRLIVKFKEGAPEDFKDILHANLACDCHEKNPKMNFHVVHVKKKDAEKAIKDYKASGQVEFVEEDALVPPAAEPAFTPNDPSVPSQWYLTKLQCQAAWDTTKGENVILAVCDTGVDATHPDLAGNVLAGYNSADGTTVSSPVHPHGTHVAGTIAAIGNNSVGVCGIAFKAKILPVRITNDPAGLAYFSAMASAIQWAADRGAKAINLSYITYNGGFLSSAVLSACNYAKSKGAVVCIAAGNDNLNPVGTADPANAIYVAATDSNDAKASFSNYGNYVDVAAPGVNILATVPNGGYQSWNGTSMATPCVTATCGLCFSANPNLTADDVIDIITSTADDLGAVGEDVYFGKGRINTFKAVQKAVSTIVNNPPTVTILNPANNAQFTVTDTVNLQGVASDDHDGDLSSSISWSSSLSGFLGVGATLSLSLSAGSHVITGKVSDVSLLQGAASISISVINPSSISPPSNLRLVKKNGMQVTIAWTDNSNNETNFAIERKARYASTYDVVGTVNANTTQFTDTVPSVGHWIYRVRAFNNTNVSNYSNAIQIRIK